MITYTKHYASLFAVRNKGKKKKKTQFCAAIINQSVAGQPYKQPSSSGKQEAVENNNNKKTSNLDSEEPNGPREEIKWRRYGQQPIVPKDQFVRSYSFACHQKHRQIIKKICRRHWHENKYCSGAELSTLRFTITWQKANATAPSSHSDRRETKHMTAPI